MADFNDGWTKTPYRSKRKRGPKCATKRLKYFLVGDQLIPVWKPKGIKFTYYRCFGHVEKGQIYCVKCRAIHKKLTELERAPKQDKR